MEISPSKENHLMFAKTTNGETWELLQKETLSEEEQELLLYTAYASAYHWSKVGTQLHSQRAEWLISRAHSKLNDGVATLTHARKCLALTNEENILDIIDLRETFGKNESEIKRVKGRIIGRDGKIRRMLEEFTDANISVYGHTISIIGDYDAIFIAREAIRMLLNGKQHSTVYRFLMRKKRERKKIEKTELWEKDIE